MQLSRKTLLSVVALMLLAPTLFAAQVKNVIIMIPDGMSNPGVGLTRWYYGGQPLALDQLACGLVRTYSADAAIADSAPAATAMATGFKSHTGFIGVLPEKADMPGQKPIASGEALRPVASVMEAARLKGKSTGLVVTCEVMHATPAAFASHDPSRKNYDNLSEQMVYNGLDVVMGGGYKFFTPQGRKDGEDLIGQLHDQGYRVITTPAELKTLNSGKVFGLFAPEALAYEMDRDPAKQPSLAEMTAKTIDLLSRDKDGFCMMVEGSKIDWAAHANDPVGLVSDIKSFDDAVRVALDFARRDGQTAIIIMADHGNGGISMGDASTTKIYDKTVLNDYFNLLWKVKKTGEGLEAELAAGQDAAAIRATVQRLYAISDLSDAEVAAIQQALVDRKGELNYVVGPMISTRSHLGWTSGGHTGEEVVLYAYGPERPTGLIENSDVAAIIARYLGLDLKTTTGRLFQEATTAFGARGASLNSDAAAANPVLTVTKGDQTVKLPANKSYAEVGGRRVHLDGVTVFNGKAWYVSQGALGLVH